MCVGSPCEDISDLEGIFVCIGAVKSIHDDVGGFPRAIAVLPQRPLIRQVVESKQGIDVVAKNAETCLIGVRIAHGCEESEVHSLESIAMLDVGMDSESVQPVV